METTATHNTHEQEERMELIIELPNGLTEGEVKATVIRERQAGIEHTKNKRTRFETRKKRYLNISDTENKIYNRIIYSTIETLQSLYVKDSPAVDFSIEGLYFDEMENNINMAASSDLHKMGGEEKKEKVQFYKFYYGVAIEVFDEWNDYAKRPNYIVVNPLAWICDPEMNVNSEARFHGFEMDMDESEIKEEYGFFNIDMLKQTTYSEIQQQMSRGNNNRDINEMIDPTKYKIYHHYTRINGRPYLITMGCNCKVLIRCEELKAVTKAQKKDPRLIPFPVIVRNRCPLDDDPWGVSIFDIMEDKQMAMQLFDNLNRIKAEHEALGDTFFYDPAVIDKISELTKPSTGPRFVKANLKKGNPVFELPKPQIRQDAINMPEILRTNVQRDMALDDRSLGVSGDSAITATENQRVQANANLRQLLGFRRDARAEKKFWEYWYQLYQQCFTGTKVIKQKAPFGSTTYELKAAQFVTYQHIEVTVTSIQDSENKNEREKLAYMAIRQTIITDPTRPKISKLIAERELHRLNGMDRSMIYNICPYSKEELKAQKRVELINRDEMPPPIIDLNEDHRAYIIIYQRCRDTEAKHKAIDDRINALSMSGQDKLQPPAGAEMKNPAQGQMLNSLMNSNMATQSNTLQTANG